MSYTYNNILVVNVNWLGDVVFSSSVFKALKENFPQAKISCLAHPRIKEILECIPAIDEIIIYDEDKKHRSPLKKLKLILKLREKKFDAAYLLHRSLTRALLVFLSGIPVRVGYDEKGRGFLLTHKIPPAANNIHRGDHYLNVVESYGIKVKDRKTELVLDEESNRAAQEILKEHGIVDNEPFIVVNTGGNWDLKRWPKENFKRLIDCLGSRQEKIVISGSENDRKQIQAIVKGLDVRPIVLAGKTSLKQLAALFSQARCVISADSGPLHLAGSVGTPTIGLFGPTRPELTGPRGRGQSLIIQNDVGCNRQACYHLSCKDNICMKSITINQVMEALDHALKA